MYGKGSRDGRIQSAKTREPKENIRKPFNIIFNQYENAYKQSKYEDFLGTHAKCHWMGTANTFCFNLRVCSANALNLFFCRCCFSWLNGFLLLSCDFGGCAPGHVPWTQMRLGRCSRRSAPVYAPWKYMRSRHVEEGCMSRSITLMFNMWLYVYIYTYVINLYTYICVHTVYMFVCTVLKYVAILLTRVYT